MTSCFAPAHSAPLRAVKILTNVLFQCVGYCTAEAFPLLLGSCVKGATSSFHSEGLEFCSPSQKANVQEGAPSSLPDVAEGGVADIPLPRTEIANEGISLQQGTGQTILQSNGITSHLGKEREMESQKSMLLSCMQSM